VPGETSRPDTQPWFIAPRKPARLGAGFDFNPHATEIRNFVREVSQETPVDAVLLDAGAGQCQYRDSFKHTRYIAADFARGDSNWDYSKLDIICVLHQIPLAPASMDVILCTEVMEHIYNPLEVMRELSRVLRPGGTIYATVPFTLGEHQVPHDYYRYTRFALGYILKQANLQPVFIRPVHGYFFRLLCDLRVSGKYLKHTLWHVPFLAMQIFIWLFMNRLESRDLDHTNTSSFQVKAVKI
jgi:SAM-dependent methyltransferase